MIAVTVAAVAVAAGAEIVGEALNNRPIESGDPASGIFNVWARGSR